MVFLREIKMDLPCTLTAEERVQRGAAGAQLTGEIEDMEAAEKARHALAAGEIKAKVAQLSAVARAVRDGTEDRQTACDLEADPDRGTVRAIRRDTGSVAFERAWSETERKACADAMQEEIPATKRVPPSRLMATYISVCRTWARRAPTSIVP